MRLAPPAGTGASTGARSPEDRRLFTTWALAVVGFYALVAAAALLALEAGDRAGSGEAKALAVKVPPSAPRPAGGR